MYESSIACEGNGDELAVFGSSVTTVVDGRDGKGVVEDEKRGVLPQLRK